jgi:hypothetical protein
MRIDAEIFADDYNRIVRVRGDQSLIGHEDAIKNIVTQAGCFMQWSSDGHGVMILPVDPTTGVFDMVRIFETIGRAIGATIGMQKSLRD